MTEGGEVVEEGKEKMFTQTHTREVISELIYYILQKNY